MLGINGFIKSNQIKSNQIKLIWFDLNGLLAILILSVSSARDFGISFRVHGGESRDNLQQYSDRTDRNIRHYLFNTQWIFIRLSADSLSLFVASRYLNAVSMDAVFFHTNSSKNKKSLFELFEVVLKTTARNIKHFRIWLLLTKTR